MVMAHSHMLTSTGCPYQPSDAHYYSFSVQVVVAQKNSSGKQVGGKEKGMRVKVVDRRMKKELRAEKARSKRGSKRRRR